MRRGRGTGARAAFPRRTSSRRQPHHRPASHKTCPPKTATPRPKTPRIARPSTAPKVAAAKGKRPARPQSPGARFAALRAGTVKGAMPTAPKAKARPRPKRCP